MQRYPPCLGIVIIMIAKPPWNVMPPWDIWIKKITNFKRKLKGFSKNKIIPPWDFINK